MEDDEWSWDDAKAADNIKNHDGVSFDDAKLVFSDRLAVELGEDRRGYDEQRFNIIGRSGDRLLFVTYTERGDRIHIISARPVERHERAHWLRSNPPEFF
jgi:uncharacterized DUF497 family protein